MICAHFSVIFARTDSGSPARPPPTRPPPSRTFPTPPPRQSLSGMPTRAHILRRTKWSSKRAASARMRSNPDMRVTKSRSLSVSSWSSGCVFRKRPTRRATARRSRFISSNETVRTRSSLFVSSRRSSQPRKCDQTSPECDAPAKMASQNASMEMASRSRPMYAGKNA